MITFIGSVTSVQKKEITPHQPKQKLMRDIFQKYLSMHARQRFPLICFVGALAVQTWH